MYGLQPWGLKVHGDYELVDLDLEVRVLTLRTLRLHAGSCLQAGVHPGQAWMFCGFPGTGDLAITAQYSFADCCTIYHCSL